MWFTDLLGRTQTMQIVRLGRPGAQLALHDSERRDETLLLPRGELPEQAHEGQELEVFVHLDSEDRPIATLRVPRLELGEVAFLTVTDVNRFGAFVDIGLVKELLVPWAEQTRQLSVGEQHPIGLIRDRTGRLAGTMRIRELLQVGGRFEQDEWVLGEVWRYEPGIGLFCLIERRFLGLVPASEPHTLRRGESAEFRVAHVSADGKLELSLRGHVHEQLETDARHVLAILSRDAPAV
ncbi:MAG TPA: S1-like domain-containing RNA-binding protein, partial [Polyangiales bacterium]|nr:S1-like domain-containing RNA-binding protein [Polyangiales bacterium]